MPQSLQSLVKGTTMKCKVCEIEFRDLIRHLKNSIKCQSSYDMQVLINERKAASFKKKSSNNKKYYENNKADILEKKGKHYEENHENILHSKKQYYTENKEIILEKRRKSRPKDCQRKRFQKHFTGKDAMKYITEQQEHLFHHTEEFCQPETMPHLNHSIELDNGLCHSCQEMSSIKIIGVNRLVCLKCTKAHCYLCKAEVSPDPSLGYLHYSPDLGSRLEFIPGYCALYSLYPNDVWSRNARINQKDCRICKDTKNKYPEYELFLGTEKDIYSWCKSDEQFYICNLCPTSKIFVCQFDLHMRSHTKYGQNIAVLALKADIDFDMINSRRGHVNESDFFVIESELMEIEGLIAVLTVLEKSWLENVGCKNLLENIPADFNLGAFILLKPGTNIQNELLKKISVDSFVVKYKLITVRNHFISTYTTFGRNVYFEEFFLYRERENYINKRNYAILEERCQITYPQNIYKSTRENTHLNRLSVMSIPMCNPARFPVYETEVLKYLWKLVKFSDLCCCVSKFFCTSSTNLEKCKEGCCGKCSSTILENELLSSESESESYSWFESDSETDNKSSESEKETDEDFIKNLSS